MPYYSELSVREPRAVSVFSTYTPTASTSPLLRGIDFDEWTRLVTFRSGAPKGNLKNATLVDYQVDKYAYFLESSRDRKFESALRARGMDLTKMPPDTGHPFTLERYRHLWRGTGRIVRGSYVYDVKGWINPTFSVSVPMPSIPASSVDTFAFQSWGRMAPTSEMFDAGQFLGELREGLPSIVPSLLKGKIAFFKDLGSDYLNVEFGWKPFLNDLQNAWKALQSAQQSISRPFGPVHRYREVETPLSTTQTDGLSSISVSGNPFGSSITDAEIKRYYPTFNTAGGWEVFNRSTTTFVEQKNWFEANFFLLPKLGYDPSSFMSRLDSLVNTRITPSLLWELAPWSWLVDWGLKIGDALDTAERLADDRVHAQYAYGMSHTKVRQHHTISSFSAAAMYERKERVRANPYGFKVGGYAGLNTWQQSILLALGLTKTR